jgi:serine/threonine protein kinase/HAMP domain-containing protein
MKEGPNTGRAVGDVSVEDIRDMDQTVFDPGAPRAQAKPDCLDLGSWAPAEDPALARSASLPDGPSRGAASRPGAASSDPPRAARAKPAAVHIALPEGFRLLEYRIDGVLGQGGFGIAYRATDVNLHAKVVIKEYLPEEFAYRAVDGSVRPRDDEDRDFYQKGLDSFLVEARTLATFRHPHIVRVARFFEANRTAYMVLEYERGESLKSWRRKHESVPEATIVSLLAPLFDGLALVHRSGYLHRDIKPDNIYVRDEDGSLVLLDFGAARQTANEKAETGSVVTPGYAAIEQYAGGGRQGPWTDIYSLGATLFWLITGKKPMEAPTRLQDPDPQPSARLLGQGRYSEEFLGAIDWALQLHPGDRPGDIEDFRSMLFGSHAGALGLQEALRKGEAEDSSGKESWAVTLRSPRLIKARFVRFSRGVWHPPNWPITVKMTLAMVLTALAPLMIVAYYNYESTQEHLAGVELRNLEQLAKSTAGRIAQLINDSRNLANYVGTDYDFVKYLGRPTPRGTQEVLRKLQLLVAANPDIHFAMVMDPAGTAVVATDPQVMGKNFKFGEYFKQAMQGSPYMTGIVVGSGAAGVFYSRPVLDDSGKVIGAVVMRIKAEPIAQILAGAQLGKDRSPFLVDGHGVVVWHPDESLMYKSLAPLSQATLDGIVADQRFRRQTIESLDQPGLAAKMIGAKQGGNVAYYSSVTHREEIAGYAPVPGIDWVVGVSESRHYFAAPLERLFWKVVSTVLLVGAVFLLLAMLFARSIVQPIERLTGAAHALKSGDYDKANIAVRTGDEIGQLARTFNVMIDVLRQRERERAGGRGAPLGYDRGDRDA